GRAVLVRVPTREHRHFTRWREQPEWVGPACRDLLGSRAGWLSTVGGSEALAGSFVECPIDNDVLRRATDNRQDGLHYDSAGRTTTEVHTREERHISHSKRASNVRFRVGVRRDRGEP